MIGTSEFSMFGDTYNVDMSVMQMESVASDLVVLLKHSGLSRVELARKLGWSKGRVTRVLSGDENLTIKTITSVAEALEYGFDVVFYNKNYAKPKQPWQIDRLNKSIQVDVATPKAPIKFKIQKGKEVFEDLMKGNDSDLYISVVKTTANQIDSQIIVNNRQPVRAQLCVNQSLSYPISINQKDRVNG